LHRHLLKGNETLLGPLLSFCLRQESLDRVVVGCESLKQFEGIVTVLQKTMPDTVGLENFALTDRRFLDPSGWT
jgi:hypothetical protein